MTDVLSHINKYILPPVIKGTTLLENMTIINDFLLTNKNTIYTIWNIYDDNNNIIISKLPTIDNITDYINQQNTLLTYYTDYYKKLLAAIDNQAKIKLLYDELNFYIARSEKKLLPEKKEWYVQFGLFNSTVNIPSTRDKINKLETENNTILKILNLKSNIDLLEIKKKIYNDYFKINNDVDIINKFKIIRGNIDIMIQHLKNTVNAPIIRGANLWNDEYNNPYLWYNIWKNILNSDVINFTFFIKDYDKITNIYAHNKLYTFFNEYYKFESKIRDKIEGPCSGILTDFLAAFKDLIETGGYDGDANIVNSIYYHLHNLYVSFDKLNSNNDNDCYEEIKKRFIKFFRIPVVGGKPSKLRILGRERKIVMKGRAQYCRYKGELRKVSELRKLESKLEKQLKKK